MELSDLLSDEMLAFCVEDEREELLAAAYNYQSEYESNLGSTYLQEPTPVLPS